MLALILKRQKNGIIMNRHTDADKIRSCTIKRSSVPMNINGAKIADINNKTYPSTTLVKYSLRLVRFLDSCTIVNIIAKINAKSVA
ncbi:MAG: hypothetical protein MUF78_10875, partial [Candidatus Edwardsbacteria bacterium]|nr:hypothetical protein [Candidatus Edwardsbacteria bacterium]